MERAHAHPLPARDPISGGPLVITEIEAVESGVTIRGRFEVPRFARLSPDQARYLETFLRCRGMLNSVERELGISYPTARARLDAVLRALDLHAVREDPPSPPSKEATPSTEEPEEETPSLYEAATPWDEPAEEEDRAFDLPPAEGASMDEAESIEVPDDGPQYSREEILSMLERGELTVEDVKRELGKVR